MKCLAHIAAIAELEKLVEKKELQIKNLQQTIRDILDGEVPKTDEAAVKRFIDQFGN